jgi:nitrite reductase/ring-hydroxylating ferredoxin subunit
MAQPARTREPREYAVARPQDVPEGTHRVVRAGNRELGLFNIRGKYHAIPNLCPHQRGPLCEGAVSGTLDYGPHTKWRLAWIWEDEVVTCPWHGLEFHVPTGQCVALPEIRIRTFQVRVQDGEIRVVV